VLLAAVIAVLIRKKDTPAEPILSQLVSAGAVFVYAIVAEVVAVFLADSQGIGLENWAGLVLLVGAAVGGMAFVRSVLNIVVPPAPETPPNP
jgi:hypothetical protein